MDRGLGGLSLGCGDFEKAGGECRGERELAPGWAADARKMGIVLANRGAMREAMAELQRANVLQPGVPETLLELGKATAAAGDGVAAEKLLLCN